jgi:hypothetical protein|tara:strand:+ start:2553 stop:2789 length:237 start_codon:yes stop_codon:yes gene_type:complete
MSIRFLKVEGHGDLIRDTGSNGIINTNRSEYEIYMKRTKARLTQHDKMQDVCREVNDLKKELREIKGLLMNIGKNNGN